MFSPCTYAAKRSGKPGSRMQNDYHASYFPSHPATCLSLCAEFALTTSSPSVSSVLVLDRDVPGIPRSGVLPLPLLGPAKRYIPLQATPRAAIVPRRARAGSPPLPRLLHAPRARGPQRLPHSLCLGHLRRQFFLGLLGQPHRCSPLPLRLGRRRRAPLVPHEPRLPLGLHRALGQLLHRPRPRRPQPRCCRHLDLRCGVDGALVGGRSCSRIAGKHR